MPSEEGLRGLPASPSAPHQALSVSWEFGAPGVCGGSLGSLPAFLGSQGKLSRPCGGSEIPGALDFLSG